MRRDFPKNRASTKKSNQWRKLIVAPFLILIVIALSVLVYQQRHTRLQSAINSMEALKAWVMEHTNHAHQQIAQIKKIVAKPDTPPEIHFEFYTALPKMQVAVDSTPAQSSVTSSPKLLVTNKPSVKVATLKPVSKPLVAKPFMSPDDLAKEFSKHIQSYAYNLQLGLFKSNALASDFSSKLVQKGFNTKVFKISLGQKTWYRVQTATITNKDEAKQLQQKLQRQGINAILHTEETT